MICFKGNILIHIPPYFFHLNLLSALFVQGTNRKANVGMILCSYAINNYLRGVRLAVKLLWEFDKMLIDNGPDAYIIITARRDVSTSASRTSS